MTAQIVWLERYSSPKACSCLLHLVYLHQCKTKVAVCCCEFGIYLHCSSVLYYCLFEFTLIVINASELKMCLRRLGINLQHSGVIVDTLVYTLLAL